MRIKFIASESMGVRSMATFIDCSGYKIFIDPGVALAPFRFGLRPHPIEVERREELWLRVVEYASKSDVIIITHYHYDHFNPRSDIRDVFGDKILFMKDTVNHINPSQIRRSHFLLHRFEDESIKVDIKVADGGVFDLGSIVISFSQPIHHGHDDRLGYVLMVCIDDGTKKFLFSSDVEGPYRGEAVKYVYRVRPNILYIDGPMLYLTGGKAPIDVLNVSRENLASILSLESVEVVVVDHHLLRDINYGEWIREVLESTSYGGNIYTAAEYMGMGNDLLEARRDKLYEENPVKK